MEWNDMDTNKMKEIEERASALLKEYGYNLDVGGYLNIFRFAQWQGFTVGNAQLRESEDGFIVIRPDYNKEKNGDGLGPKVIGVNEERDLAFKRFVVAHELGHAALHYNGAGLYRHREDKTGKTPDERERENEADYFAAAVLMPAQPFYRRYQELHESGLKVGQVCFRLAEEFRVPLASVLRRVDEVQEIAL